MFAIASVANVNDVEPATHSVAIILAFGYPARYAFIRIVSHFSASFRIIMPRNSKNYQKGIDKSEKMG